MTRVLKVGPLPDGALKAAAEFHADVLPDVLAELGMDPPRSGEDLVLVFGPASYDHRGWRLAVVQDLAREAAPTRVNAIVGHDEGAIADALAYLEAAPGVTGQLLAVEPA
jgi:hypothetical protein